MDRTFWLTWRLVNLRVSCVRDKGRKEPAQGRSCPPDLQVPAAAQTLSPVSPFSARLFATATRCGCGSIIPSTDQKQLIPAINHIPTRKLLVSHSVRVK